MERGIKGFIGRFIRPKTNEKETVLGGKPISKLGLDGPSMRYLDRMLTKEYRDEDICARTSATGFERRIGSAGETELEEMSEKLQKILRFAEATRKLIKKHRLVMLESWEVPEELSKQVEGAERERLGHFMHNSLHTELGTELAQTPEIVAYTELTHVSPEMILQRRARTEKSAKHEKIQQAAEQASKKLFACRMRMLNGLKTRYESVAKKALKRLKELKRQNAERVHN